MGSEHLLELEYLVSINNVEWVVKFMEINHF